MSAVNRHFAHSPQGRWVRLDSFSFQSVNARLHETMSEASPRLATLRPIANSVMGRSNDK